MTEERIDIAASVAEICDTLGLDATYVARLDITPGDLTVELYRGKEGRCKGPKYFDPATNEIPMETLTFRVQT